MVLTQIFYFEVDKYMACYILDNMRTSQPEMVVKYWYIYVSKYETKLHQEYEKWGWYSVLIWKVGEDVKV